MVELRDFNKNRSSELDVALVVDGQKLHVNRGFLSTILEMFKGMTKRKTIELNGPLGADLKYDQFLELMKIIHPPDEDLKALTVEYLLDLVHYFDIDFVFHLADDFLQNKDREYSQVPLIKIITLQWKPIDACDALELLLPSFTHPFVRRFAVKRLSLTAHNSIISYLPQLVQALRYEPKALDIDVKTAIKIVEYFGPESDLASFLIRSAVDNGIIANFLYWYLKVEIQVNAEPDESTSLMYSKVLNRLKSALFYGSDSSRRTYEMLMSQTKFVENLVDAANFISDVNGNRTKKLDALKLRLAETEELVDLKGIPLPLDPLVRVKSIISDQTYLFSSELMPMKLSLLTECGETYTVIFKRGDDLRQDHLVIQLIRLIDSLLKDEKLDLRLTPYAVLATNVNGGFVQFIEATPLTYVKRIQDFLRNSRPSESGPYGIEPQAFDNYVRSCAGYSIISYILGIGDRHLDNILLCEDGRIFHIDFGFILGRDPKPMPPPVKLTNDMINAMGGQNSDHYTQFLDYSATAFCILRRHAKTIANLVALMLDSGIPDIVMCKDKAVQKVIDRFHPDLTDEYARQLILTIIKKSIGSTMGYIVDLVHEAKQKIS